MEPDWIVTAFENIDGATRLRLKYSDSSQFETDQLLSWNRRQDWAVVKAGPAKAAKLRPAAADSWSVGDTAMYLESAPEGNRIITNVSIDGKNVFPGAGMRVNISAAPTEAAIGACLLNEYGEVIGVIGGTIVPGASAMRFLEIASPTPVAAGSTVYMRGGLAVPIAMVPATSAEALTPLSVLNAKGEFLPPVTASKNVVFGQLARTVNSKGGVPFPVDSTDSFSKRDVKVNVYVLWEGREKIKGLVTVRLFDIENHLLNKAWLEKPTKFSINRGEQKTTTWEFPTASLPAGVYRIDVWLDDAPAWRTFWKLSE